MSREKHNGPSWFWVMFWLVCFWPVGLYLMIRKLTGDKQEAIKKHRSFSPLGWLLLFIGFFSLSSSIASRSNALLAVFFLCGGILLIHMSKKSARAGDRYRHYIALVVNQGITGIAEIAAVVGVPYKTAEKDLRKMIRMGYFQNGFIDEGRGEIHLFYQQEAVTGYSAGPRQVLRGDSAALGSHYVGRGSRQDVPLAGQSQPQPMDRPVKTVTCYNCGAYNQVLGVSCFCEYCGSPLG